MKASVLTMIVAPFGRSARFAFSAAGFIATSTSGRSPAVRMSWSAKWTWNPETPGSEPAGADLGREVRERREVVPERGGLAREAVAGELHAVTRVTREADDHALELLDPLDRAHRGRAPRAARGGSLSGARGEQLVRVDLADPPEEVPLGVVLGAPLDRDASPRRRLRDARGDLLTPPLRLLRRRTLCVPLRHACQSVSRAGPRAGRR